MSKQLANAISELLKECRLHDSEYHHRTNAAVIDRAILAIRETPRASRPWKATAEQEREQQHWADYDAFLKWASKTQPDAFSGDETMAERDAYLLCCAVADAIAPPPTFAHRVALDQIADWIASQHEVTVEEVQALFRPKVRALGKWKWEEHHNAWVAMLGEDIEYWVQPENNFFRWHCMWQSHGEGECATLELAQAAAQAHWEARAEEFWKVAFE